MAYAADSKSATRKGMRVRLPPPGPPHRRRGARGAPDAAEPETEAAFIGYRGRPDCSPRSIDPADCGAAAASRGCGRPGTPDRDICDPAGAVTEGADRLDGQRARANRHRSRRLRRLVSFTLMDQLPDFTWYERRSAMAGPSSWSGSAAMRGRARSPARSATNRGPLHQPLRPVRDRGGRTLARARARRPERHAPLTRAAPRQPVTSSAGHANPRPQRAPCSTNSSVPTTRPPPPSRHRPHRRRADAATAAGDTATVRRIVAKLEAMPPEQARFVASAAYTLARAANADLDISDEETAAIETALQSKGTIDEADRGPRDRDGQAPGEDRRRHRGLRRDPRVPRPSRPRRSASTSCAACFAISAANGTISAEEASEVNEIARELDLEPAARERDPGRVPRPAVGRPGGPPDRRARQPDA